MTTMFTHTKQFHLNPDIEAPQFFDIPGYYSQIEDVDKRIELNSHSLKVGVDLSYPKVLTDDIPKTRKICFLVNPMKRPEGYVKLAPVCFGHDRQNKAQVYACLL